MKLLDNIVKGYISSQKFDPETIKHIQEFCKGQGEDLEAALTVLAELSPTAVEEVYGGDVASTVQAQNHKCVTDNLGR